MQGKGLLKYMHVQQLHEQQSIGQMSCSLHMLNFIENQIFIIS